MKLTAKCRQMRRVETAALCYTTLTVNIVVIIIIIISIVITVARTVVISVDIKQLTHRSMYNVRDTRARCILYSIAVNQSVSRFIAGNNGITKIGRTRCTR